MTQWFVKDLSKLTHVSVQTLHHYDRINLLKPSLRLSNGYRVYSEKDLLKLQQIVALKFFGFGLSEIGRLLSDASNTLAHFDSQIKVLEQRAAALLEASGTLKGILLAVDSTKSIPWETIMQTIEVYKMTEDLEHDWVREIFTTEELKEYAAFEMRMKKNNSKEVFEKQWQELLALLEKNITKAPESPEGIQLAEQYMAFINGIYGREYAHLRTRKWEKGFGEGKGLEDVGLTPERMAWLEKAMNAYWKKRLFGILEKAGTLPDSDLRMLWDQALDEMYGNETARKNAIYDIALQDEHISPAAKKWLKNMANTLK